MKIPSDVSAKRLSKLLETNGYAATRQRGSHVRFTKTMSSNQFHLTVPMHNPVKVGTLRSILKELSRQSGLTIEDLLQELNEL